MFARRDQSIGQESGFTLCGIDMFPQNLLILGYYDRAASCKAGFI